MANRIIEVKFTKIFRHCPVKFILLWLYLVIIICACIFRNIPETAEQMLTGAISIYVGDVRQLGRAVPVMSDSLYMHIDTTN